MSDTILWIGFGIFILALLALDLGVFNRKAHEVRIKEALIWSAFWIGLAIGFNVLIYYIKGYDSAVAFATAYLVEKSLSMDNLFVFLMIFTYFKVPIIYQHRVLFWGVVGAIIMRMGFIFAGIAIINRFDWILYVFGALLVYSAYKMIKEKDKEIHPEKNPLIRAFRRLMPVTSDYIEGRFFTGINGKILATPLFIVLLVIESSDVMFAIDSIPAVLAISTDPFIVYTSNIMAILGLRALYFAVASVMKYFHYLNYGLAIILGYIGVKMIAVEFIHIPPFVSLGIIFSVILVSIILSVIIKKTDKKFAEI